MSLSDNTQNKTIAIVRKCLENGRGKVSKRSNGIMSIRKMETGKDCRLLTWMQEINGRMIDKTFGERNWKV